MQGLNGRLASSTSWYGPERSFWGILALPERAVLWDAGHTRVFAPGAVVLREGEAPANVLVGLWGYAQIVASSVDGARVLLALRGPGDVLGEMSVTDGRPRSAAIVAMSQLTALVVPAERFSRILNEHPLVTRTLLTVVSGRLHEADRDRVSYAGTTVVRRLALLLNRLAQQYGEQCNDGVVLTLPITQSDLAQMVGGSREAVARGLRELRKRGIVLTGRRRIAIRDPEGLRASIELRSATDERDI